jgi:hypothetical protein
MRSRYLPAASAAPVRARRDADARGEPLEQGGESRLLFRLLRAAGAPERRTRPPERFPESVGVERLEQVVEGVHLEGPHGVLVVRGDEHDGRHVPRPYLGEHAEAVELRHLYVEKHEVG